MVIQIEQARRLLVEAEREYAVAEENARELQTLIKFLRRQIEQNAASTLPLPLGSDAPAGDVDYSTMTIPDAVAEVLEREGRPMHVKVLAERIIAGGRTSNTKTLVASVFSAASRHQERFVQTGRGTFGLRERMNRQIRPAV